MKSQEGAERIGSACADVCIGERSSGHIAADVYFLQCGIQGYTECCAGRTDVLERGCRGHFKGLVQFMNQLPGVECVQQVDVARPSIEHRERQGGVSRRENGGLALMGVAAVLEVEAVPVTADYFHKLSGLGVGIRVQAV